MFYIFDLYIYASSIYTPLIVFPVNLISEILSSVFIAKFSKALVAGAMVGDDALVYLLKDNNFGLYDFSKNSIIYNNKAEKVFSIDTRVANPIQVENLVVVPLLDGKLSILDLKTLKITKEIIISTNSVLNNVIFLKRFKNSLIASTPHSLISYSNKGKREFKRETKSTTLSSKKRFRYPITQT